MKGKILLYLLASITMILKYISNFLIFTTLISGFALSNNHQDNLQKVSDIIDPPQSAAINIIVSSLSSLKELRKQKQASLENIEKLIRIKLLPNIDVNFSSKISMGKYWEELTDSEKKLIETYIIESLIQDYIGILGTYKELDSINITAGKNIVREDNLARIPIIISYGKEKQSVNVEIGLIKTNSWKIYDITYSGVSLIKNYQAQFASLASRKGLEFLINNITKRVLTIKK